VNEAAVNGKQDHLMGLKGNVIVGHLIQVGTGLRTCEKLVIGSKEEFEKLMQAKKETMEEDVREFFCVRKLFIRFQTFAPD
jgi:DNA-directed RNA polymerase subunit beta'